MSARIRFAMLFLSLATGMMTLASPSFAQDKKDEKKDGLKQKDAVAANLKKADLTNANVIETEHFLLATSIPKEKAKALGVLLEKVVPVARRGAQFEEKEEPWKGKLAVYYLPVGRDFKSFIRNVIVDQPDGVHFDLRSDNPLVVDPAEVAGKATEAEQFANNAALVAGAYLKGKAGIAKVPDWLADGFGRVTAMRAEGTTSKRYAAYKSAARAAALGTKGKPAAIADLWAEDRPMNMDAVANSLAEYLAYGPGKENFPKLISGFRPNENGGIPTAQQALEAAGWKDIAMLETAWRKWVQTGK